MNTEELKRKYGASEEMQRVLALMHEQGFTPGQAFAIYQAIRTFAPRCDHE